MPLKAPDDVTKGGDEAGVHRQNGQRLDGQAKGPDYVIALLSFAEDPQVNVLGYDLGVDEDGEDKQEGYIHEDIEEVILVMVHVLPDDVALRWCWLDIPLKGHRLQAFLRRQVFHDHFLKV